MSVDGIFGLTRCEAHIEHPGTKWSGQANRFLVRAVRPRSQRFIGGDGAESIDGGLSRLCRAESERSEDDVTTPYALLLFFSGTELLLLRM